MFLKLRASCPALVFATRPHPTKQRSASSEIPKGTVYPGGRLLCACNSARDVTDGCIHNFLDWTDEWRGTGSDECPEVGPDHKHKHASPRRSHCKTANIHTLPSEAHFTALSVSRNHASCFSSATLPSDWLLLTARQRSSGLDHRTRPRKPRRDAHHRRLRSG